MTGLHDCTTRLALDLFGMVQERLAQGTLTKKKLVWLELTGCSGNIISMMNADLPDFGYLITGMVDLVYDNTLSVADGGRAMEELFDVLDDTFILAIEGAVATKSGGRYTIIGKHRGRDITALDAARIFGERAEHVLAVGTCASDGGFSAASPNPGACVGIQDVLKRPVVRLPGCPCHPGWFISTLAHILLYGPPELDAFGRPVMIYGTTIHDRCQRRSYFDSGIFATRLGEPTCLFLVGCRGPVTLTDCPIRRWNQRVNWPVQDDSPCIGCAQFGFPDVMEPFITYPEAPNASGNVVLPPMEEIGQEGAG